jgi:hypothetical protein
VSQPLYLLELSIDQRLVPPEAGVVRIGVAQRAQRVVHAIHDELSRHPCTQAGRQLDGWKGSGVVSRLSSWS